MSINLNLRGDLGRKLSISELDSNFSNIQDAINNGSSKTFQLKAHSSLTTDDIGKFVISYSDPSWNDYIIGGGTPSSFTASLNEARLPFLAGTTSGVNGKWTIDFAATYGGKDWEQLQDNERFIEIQFNNSISIFKYNLQFQELDPYLSPIINSMTYSFDNIGQGTFSFTEDPISLAILFEYYVNNGIPWAGSVNNNVYTADARYSGKDPYFITNTYSTPFVSATRSGTSVQFEISKSTQNFNSIYYFGNNFSIEADVPLEVGQPIPYLTYPVVGILESLEGGTASIGQIPEVIELSPTTGIYDGTQEQFTDIIVAFNFSTTDEFANYANYWFVSGGDDLINLLFYFSGGSDLPAFAMSATSPLYRAISSGMVGDKITFIKSTLPLK